MHSLPSQYKLGRFCFTNIFCPPLQTVQPCLNVTARVCVVQWWFVCLLWYKLAQRLAHGLSSFVNDQLEVDSTQLWPGVCSLRSKCLNNKISLCLFLLFPPQLQLSELLKGKFLIFLAERVTLMLCTDSELPNLRTSSTFSVKMVNVESLVQLFPLICSILRLLKEPIQMCFGFFTRLSSTKIFTSAWL